jgi:hypothetical protein
LNFSVVSAGSVLPWASICSFSYCSCISKVWSLMLLAW